MLTIIKTRRSVRQFENKEIGDNDLQEILEAGMYAPSAGNEQAWQFIILQGDTLAQYLKLNKNVPQSAPLGILVCRDLNLEKYKDMHSSILDCAAATQNILLAAHTKGWGAIWTAVFDNAKPGIINLLKLPGHIDPFSFVPIGYAKNVTKEIPTRYDESKVHHNTW
jgi:nitroreductase